MKTTLLIICLAFLGCETKQEQKYTICAQVRFLDNNIDTISTTVLCTNPPNLSIHYYSYKRNYLVIEKDKSSYDVVATGVKSFNQINCK